LDALPDRTVAIAGLGMLGGPLPVWLAQTGVGEIRLLDADTVEAGNLTRQPFTSTEVGQTKVGATRRRVIDAAPWSSAPSAHALYANARTASRATLASWLEGVDLLVLAMADWRANLRLADVAADLGVTMVTGWVTFGARAGVAYRTEWGRSGCPQCLEIDPRGTDQLPQAEGSNPGLFIEGCGQPTFPGSFPDGSVVTSLLGQLAIDYMRQSTPSRKAMATAIISPAPGSDPSIVWQSLPPHPDCSLCNRRR
jgi:molybdopterin/thiamine biosynthesis adenylyltransferase